MVLWGILPFVKQLTKEATLNRYNTLISFCNQQKYSAINIKTRMFGKESVQVEYVSGFFCVYYILGTYVLHAMILPISYHSSFVQPPKKLHELVQIKYFI